MVESAPEGELGMSRHIQQQIERDLVAAFEAFVRQLSETRNHMKKKEDKAAVLSALDERLQFGVGRLVILDEEDHYLEHLRYTWSQVAAGVMLAAEVCYRMEREHQIGRGPAKPVAN